MSLKQQIEKAFANVPYPGDKNITRCSYNCPECRRTAEFFKGKPTVGYTVAELSQYQLALSLFTAEAFHYFLPAFMLVTLNSYRKGDVIPDAIRFHFECSHEMMGHFTVRMSKFNILQRQAITDYLVSMESLGAGPSEHAIRVLDDDSLFA